MKRWIYLHPLLLAVAPVLFLVAHNPHEASGRLVLAVLAASLAGAALLIALGRLLARDAARGALIASAAVLLFHTYGRAFDALWAVEWDGRPVIGSSRVISILLAVVSALALAFAVRRARRARGDLADLSRGLTTFAGIMALISLLNIGRASLEPVRAAEAAPAEHRVEPILQEDPRLPDVYFLILDGYARQDVLQRLYAFDNSAFIEGLRARGFYVADQSRSNYAATFLSLTSTLNMRYLDEFKDKKAKEAEHLAQVYALLRRHEVGLRFQQRGYRYVHFNTNYRGTGSMDHADVTYQYTSPLLQDEFMAVLLRTTMLRPLEPDVASMYLYMFDALQEVPAIQGPTFTFFHLLAPHNPYVFDADGSVRTNVPLTLQAREKTGGWREKEEYLGQLQYVNKRILESIDAIVARSTVPPIIIVQSDHGSASGYRRGLKGTDRDRFWFERTATLNAWYAPQPVTERLRDDMVSVNTFRVLLSALFGEDLPDLPPHIHASWYSRPYNFVDIVGTVERAYDPKGTGADATPP